MITHFKTGFRLACILVLALSLASLGLSYTSDASSSVDTNAEAQFTDTDENLTVITTHGRKGNEILAVNREASVVYYNDSRDNYFDVDPVEGTRYTVEYVAADRIDCSNSPCIQNVVERVNLSTGEIATLYRQKGKTYDASEWHDVDRIDDSRLIVADMGRDRVFVVNTTTGIVEWQWDAQSDYSVESGGPYPGDWTHLNDVEVLADRTIMVSLRNQDEIIFLNRTGEIVDRIGRDDAHDILYEQHNPDYLPVERGGPAVVIADSENNRIVEYQKNATGWEIEWIWQDAQLQWPRDADRLPSNHTLITDTQGNRIVEIDTNGEIVWSVNVERPYEAERLGTGDESTGGYSASADQLQTQGTDSSQTDNRSFRSVVLGFALDILPSKLIHGIMYVLPAWVGLTQVIALAVLLGTSALWVIIEIVWAPYSLSLSNPVSITRKE